MTLTDTQRTGRIRLLAALLRLAGAVTVTAFLAVLMPRDWMAATHSWLGLGEFPRAPIVDYLARSVAALYGFHGVLLLIVSRDPVKYKTLVTFVGFMDIIAGLIATAIDLHAPMPIYWTIVEGPPIAVFGMVLLYLRRAIDEA